MLGFVPHCVLFLQVDLHPIEFKDCVNDDTSGQLLTKIRKLQLQDRAVYDKAVRAFVSYFKAYSKYECSLILRIKGKISLSAS